MTAPARNGFLILPRRADSGGAARVRPPSGIGLTPEVGGLSSRLNHALTCVVTCFPARRELTCKTRPAAAEGGNASVAAGRGLNVMSR